MGSAADISGLRSLCLPRVVRAPATNGTVDSEAQKRGASHRPRLRVGGTNSEFSYKLWEAGGMTPSELVK